jgi:hypothetical protein
MGNNHLRRSPIGQFDKNKTKLINPKVTNLTGWKSGGNSAHVLISLRFIQESHECFHQWGKDEMSAYWNFNRKLHESTWEMVHSSGGTGKTGFGYTLLPSSKYPNQEFIKTLDQDTNFFELRINQKSRVHGFRVESVFYACWLDKDHNIFP